MNQTSQANKRKTFSSRKSDAGKVSGEGKNKANKDGSSDPEEKEFIEKIVHIDRCAKVVKGGRRFSFAALAVVGDKNGRVGVGHGKAKEVPDAIRKANENAHKNMIGIQLKENTIPHEIQSKAGGGFVVLRPAAPGTGIIAGGGVRAVLECVGIKDVLSKSLGSNNPKSMVNATIEALKKLRSADQINEMRFKSKGDVEEI